MKEYSFFTHMGAGFLIAGYSRNKKTVSIGGGFKTHKVYTYDDENNLETISTRPSIGFFLDKNNSLLWSFVYTHGPDYHENLKIEIYPGFIKIPFEHLKLGSG